MPTTCSVCGHENPSEARFCAQCGARLNIRAEMPTDARQQVMSSLRGEERLVTVVFADMSESVRRTTGLSAEEATERVNPLLQTMAELMVRYGGRIDRFLGDGILAVFGTPTIHEDDPIRAVWAALELQERASELGLPVTVGVNTGRVYFGPVGSSVHEELTVMGPTVNLAARFQSAAQAGEVVVGSATEELVAPPSRSLRRRSPSKVSPSRSRRSRRSVYSTIQRRCGASKTSRLDLSVGPRSWVVSNPPTRLVGQSP